MNKKLYFFLILLLITGLVVFNLISTHICTEKRYAFDIGSGSIKSKAAIVNHCKGVVTEDLGHAVVHNKFVNCIGKDRHIIPECLQKGLAALTEIEKKFGINCKVDKCAGIATAWARRAQNADEVIDAFKNKSVMVEIVSQDREGEIGYHSARSNPIVRRVSEKNLIVWDIGGGSFQLSMLDGGNKIHIYSGPFGIETFERIVREKYQIYQNDELPYFDEEQLEQAIEFARVNIGEKLLEDHLLRTKLSEAKVKVFGMGRPMHVGFVMDLKLPEAIRVADLVNKAREFCGKTPEEMRVKYKELPDHFVRTAQTSLVLVAAIMKGAGIKEVNIVDSTISDYVLTEASFWDRPEKK